MGLTLEELKQQFTSSNFSSYTYQQIYNWLYSQKNFDPHQWTNLPLNVRELVSQKYLTEPLKPESSQISSDGTQKYLFKLQDNGLIESVIIPEKNRVTLCLSSQVGCSHACLFCATARQGFKRNLNVYEILSQVASLSQKHNITNIVYMGMGEPFSNWENVKKSLDILCDLKGWNFSSKKITVSTVGVFPALKEFIEKTPCHLALSLHSPFPEERKKLMPIETVYPVEKTLEYLRDYLKNHSPHRFSIEYIIFKDLNHSEKHAQALTKLLHGLKVRVNLIPYHPIGNIPLKRSPLDEMETFQKTLQKKGMTVTIRRSRGMDIDAACGMLSTKKLQQSNNEENLDY